MHPVVAAAAMGFVLAAGRLEAQERPGQLARIEAVRDAGDGVAALLQPPRCRLHKLLGAAAAVLRLRDLHHHDHRLLAVKVFAELDIALVPFQFARDQIVAVGLEAQVLCGDPHGEAGDREADAQHPSRMIAG